LKFRDDCIGGLKALPLFVTPAVKGQKADIRNAGNTKSA